MTRSRVGLRCAGALLVAAACLAPRAWAHGPRDEPSEAKPSRPVQPELGEEERYSVHFQSTMATQAHPAFGAKYSGQNSLGAEAETATAFVSTLYGDIRLWHGAELLINPELSGGKGLSHTLGIAAFPSGIVYRVGDPAPSVYIARLAISQTFGLGGGRVVNEAGPNELAGTRDRDQLAITVGRLSVADVFDGNRYAHDPTDRFFNWALFASGAWDYPADTKGYTWGILADLAVDWWSLRAGLALVPKYANLAQMDWRVDKSHGLMAEYETRYALGKLQGATSALVFLNEARMGSYDQVNENRSVYGNNVAATRADHRTKYGFALSMEQQLTTTLGAFLRWSANDGRNESWAFTEIDRSLAVGAVQNGTLWGREKDEAGAAVVVNALSPPHRRYLEGGGYGFIIGDGALRYAPEVVSDLYYRATLVDHVTFSAIYQPVVNPGYNQDRGPVHIFTGRLHVAF
ncbi:MAG TPA: carbohydrate porin [Labilithrix sp.]|nr:carbohydrate porin [Labilithrix sp.]